MFKNIILTVLIAIVLIYNLGRLGTQWLELHFFFAEQNFEPITSILLIAGIVVILVVVGFVVAMSLFAAMTLAIFAAGIGLFVAGLSVFWPVILFTMVVFLLVRAEQTPA